MRNSGTWLAVSALEAMPEVNFYKTGTTEAHFFRAGFKTQITPATGTGFESPLGAHFSTSLRRAAGLAGGCSSKKGYNGLSKGEAQLLA